MRMLLYVALLVLAPFQAVPAVQQPNDGLIEVTVRDSATRAPIPGARITFIQYGNPPPNVVTYVNADEKGQAVFQNLTPANYGINAQRPGYIAPSVQDVRRTIGSDTRKHQVEIALTRGAAVSGRVLDPNGVPIVEAQVTLATISYREGRRTMVRALSGSTQTDDRGEYRIIGVYPGDYYVQVELRSYSQFGWGGFWDDFPRVSYYPGVLDPKAATLVTIRGAQEASAIDLKLPNIRTFKISGTVINSIPGTPGSPASRRVSSYYLGSMDPDSLEDPILFSSRAAESSNPDESLFEIAGIVPGSYYLYPMWNTSSRVSGGYTSRTPIQIDDHDIENLRIVLRANGEMKGRVLVERNVPLPAGSVLRVGLRSRERLPNLLGGTTPSAPVDVATGDFTVPNVPEGRFGISLGGLPEDGYVVDARQGGRSIFDEGATATTSLPLEVTINLQGGTVQGVVLDVAGAPVPRAGVTLVPAAARRGNSQFYKRMAADPSGQFAFRGVAPGEYKVFAWSALPPGQAEENAQFLAPYEARGSAVTAAAGTTAKLQPLVITLP